MSTTLQQAIAAQDDFVTVNWVYFDRSKLRDGPLPIDAPAHCPADSLAETNTIEFWSLLSARTMVDMKPEWTKGIDDQKFDDSIEQNFLPELLADVLKELDNEDAVHLVVNVDGSYQGVVRALNFPIFNWGLAGYREILSAPGEGAQPEQYASGQANPAEAIHDGKYSSQPPFATAAPVQIFHPIFETFARLVDDHSVQPDHEDFIKVQGLMVLRVPSAIKSEGSDRNDNIRKQLSEILQVDLDERLDNDGSSVDRAYILVVSGVHVPFLVNTFRGELGEGRGLISPSKLGLAFGSLLIFLHSEQRSATTTLMLAGGGAWMCVLGGVFADKITVQRLTDMIWVGISPQRKTWFTVSHNLGTVKSFSSTSSATHHRFYPYPTSFTEKGKAPPSDARKQFEAILELLHSHGRGKAKIIDLDWAGRYERTPRGSPSVAGDPAPDEEGRRSYDYVRNPLNLSTTINRAAGVTDLAPIRPEHVKFMLSNMCATMTGTVAGAGAADGSAAAAR
ncbi:hypothetical protein BD779DRAFT_1685539 [Infundibulicybe gibba]|nr:hypothetical protein BD779DRAFT_1685539 [Infundibulicybe gibba]